MYMYMCIQASRPKPLTQGTQRQRNDLPRGKIVKTHTHKSTSWFHVLKTSHMYMYQVQGITFVSHSWTSFKSSNN